MYFQFLCVILICLVLFSEKSSVCGHPTTAATVYSEAVMVQDESYEYPASNMLGSMYAYELTENRDCEWETLSALQGPVVLAVKVFKKFPVKCSWIIEAPEGKRVYVHGFEYTIVFNVELTSDQKKSLYDNALNVSVYDGDHVDESKRLFKIGDGKLENAKSTGRKITFSLDFKRSDKYKSQTTAVHFVYV